MNLNDRDPATAAVPVRVAQLASATGGQRRTAQFTARQARRMNGRTLITATFTTADGSFSDRVGSIEMTPSEAYPGADDV